jgi:8-oxo-dGTP pyrophosphatase MutT (NUDIX family)
MIFIENEGKFLIQRTSEVKNHEYATTGGHVTYHDNGFITCKKEVNEELGVQLRDDEIEFVDTIDYKNCFCEIYYSSKSININDIKLQEEEVESVSWLGIEEIESLIEQGKFRKGNIEPFNKVLEYRNQKTR